MLRDLRGNRLQTAITEVLAAFIGKGETETFLPPSWKWASMECQPLLALHHGQSQRDVAVIVYKHHFDCFWTLNSSWILSGCFVNEMRCNCPGGCRRNIPFLFTYIGCQQHLYVCFRSRVTHMTEDAKPRIVDALLTLIFKIGQEGYCYLLGQSQQPILHLRHSTTYCLWHYPGCKTKNRWRSAGAYCQLKVGRVSERILPVTATDSSIMYNHDQINFELPDLPDLESLTLGWHSFCNGRIRNIYTLDLA